MTSSRIFLALAPLAVLAACATPAERCRIDATRDLGTVRALIAETRANISRGYTYEREVYSRPRLTFCTGSGRRHVGVSFCSGNVLDERERPVAVNLDEERAKLRSLEAKEQQLQARARQSLMACPA